MAAPPAPDTIMMVGPVDSKLAQPISRLLQVLQLVLLMGVLLPPEEVRQLHTPLVPLAQVLIVLVLFPAVTTASALAAP